MMCIACGTSLDQQVAVAAQLLAGQVRMDCASGEQGVDLGQTRLWKAIGQQHHRRTAAHGFFGLIAYILKRCLEADFLVVVEIDADLVIDQMGQREQLAQLALREHG